MIKSRLLPAQERDLNVKSLEAWGWYKAWEHSPAQRRPHVWGSMPADVQQHLTWASVLYQKRNIESTGHDRTTSDYYG